MDTTKKRDAILRAIWVAMELNPQGGWTHTHLLAMDLVNH
jgi:hypothetical protein